MEFDEYIVNVKEMLVCNSDDFNFHDNEKRDIELTERCYIRYYYNNEEIDENLHYFRNCMNDGLTPYKALLYFDEYLKGYYIDGN